MLKVQIIGEAGSGKSVLAQFIKDAVKRYGAKAIVKDIDCATGEQGYLLLEKANLILPKLEIEIETIQARRNSL
jgi:ABC-type dipeptide/oligopeptide/nickel transport system ATPase component